MSRHVDEVKLSMVMPLSRIRFAAGVCFRDKNCRLLSVLNGWVTFSSSKSHNKTISMQQVFC